MTLTLQQLRADIAAIIEQDPSAIGDSDNLIDLGLDSMRVMNLAMQWEEQGVPLDFADLIEAPTVAGLWAIVEQRRG
jgi:aryl carrier-like protein